MIVRLTRFWNWLRKDGLGFVVLLLVLLLLTVFCFYLAEVLSHNGHTAWANVTKSIGIFVFATIWIQLLFRLWVWKQIERTIFSKLGIKDAVAGCALENFWWYPQTEWSKLFQEAKSVTVFAISARSVLAGDQVGALREFLRRAGTRLTVILQDPSDETVLAALDGRFGEKVGTRKIKTLEAINELSKIGSETGVRGKVEVRISRASHAYSCYKFDDQYFFVPYLIEPTRAPERIPMFQFGPGDFVRKYLEKELNYLCSKEGSRPYESDDAGSSI